VGEDTCLHHPLLRGLPRSVPARIPFHFLTLSAPLTKIMSPTTQWKYLDAVQHIRSIRLDTIPQRDRQASGDQRGDQHLWLICMCARTVWPTVIKLGMAIHVGVGMGVFSVDQPRPFTKGWRRPSAAKFFWTLSHTVWLINDKSRHGSTSREEIMF